MVPAVERVQRAWRQWLAMGVVVWGLLAVGLSARAGVVSWGGTGIFGFDPYGQAWNTQNRGFQDVTSWGIPGRAIGNVPFAGPTSIRGIELSFFDLPAGVTIRDDHVLSFGPTMNVEPFGTTDFWVWTSLSATSGRFDPPAPASTLDPQESFFFFVPFTNVVNLSTFRFEARYELVPEPSSLSLAALGLLGVACVARHSCRRTPRRRRGV